MFRRKRDLGDDAPESAEPSSEFLSAEPGDQSFPDMQDQTAATGSFSSLEQELAELYRSTAESLFRYGLLVSRNTALAQDAVQETFLRYYVQRKHGEVHEGRAWLFRVLRNYILDQLKSFHLKMSVGLEEARGCEDRAHSPEKILENSEALKRALQILSPREFQCLQLRTEGFTYKEIADILAIEPGTVGALLARCSDKIRRAYSEDHLPCEAQ